MIKEISRRLNFTADIRVYERYSKNHIRLLEAMKLGDLEVDMDSLFQSDPTNSFLDFGPTIGKVTLIN